MWGGGGGGGAPCSQACGIRRGLAGPGRGAWGPLAPPGGQGSVASDLQAVDSVESPGSSLFLFFLVTALIEM